MGSTIGRTFAPLSRITAPMLARAPARTTLLPTSRRPGLQHEPACPAQIPEHIDLMVEGAVRGHCPALSLEEHALASRRDSPEERQLFIRQRAAWGVVPELEEATVDFSDAIGELNPRIPD